MKHRCIHLHNIVHIDIEYRRLADGPVALDGDGDGHEDGGGEGDAGHRVEESGDFKSILNPVFDKKPISPIGKKMRKLQNSFLQYREEKNFQEKNEKGIFCFFLKIKEQKGRCLTSGRGI